MAMYYAAKINGTWRYKLNGWPSVMNTSATQIPAILLALGAGHTLVIDGGLTGIEYTDADYSTGGASLSFQAASQTIRGPVVGDPDFGTICGQPIFIGANHTTVYTNAMSGCIFERITLKNSLTNGFSVNTNVTIRHCRLIDNETQLKVSSSGLVDVYGNTFEGGKDTSSIIFEVGTPTINFHNNILKQSATKYAAGISIQGTGTYNIDNNQWVGAAYSAVGLFGTPASGIVNVRNNKMLACSSFPGATGSVVVFSSGQTSTCTDNIISVSAMSPVYPIINADTNTGNTIIYPSDYAASGRHGYFCMSVDDASTVTWETLYGTDGTDGLMAIAETNGLRVTWCVDSARASSMPENIRLAHSRGHEIGAHTRTHTDLNFTGKIFDVAKTSNTITINRAANTITLSGGGTVANFRSKALSVIKTELEGLGCTVTPVANYNTSAVNGISAGVYGEAIADGTAVSQIDCYTGTSTEGYVWSEVAGCIDELETMIGGGYNIRSFAYPFGSGNATVQSIMVEIKDGQILSSRRTNIDTASSQQLADFNPQALASFNSVDVKANTTSGDTTEDIRANISGLMAYLCETGAIVSTYAHGITEISHAQWATIIEEAKKWAGKVSLMTNGDALDAVIAETVDDGDETRSKVWADGGIYHFGKKYYISKTLGLDTRTAEEAQNPLTPWARHPWDYSAAGNSTIQALIPGDTVYMYKGDTWHSCVVTTTESGDSFYPILTTSIDTFGNSSSLPIISSTLDPVSLVWENMSGGVYRTAAAGQVNVCVFDDDLLTKGSTTTPSLGQWFWSASYIYVNVGEVPPTDGRLLIGANSRNLNIATDYVEFSYLTGMCANSATHGSLFIDGQTGVKVHDCSFFYPAYYGAYLESPVECEIYNNVFAESPSIYGVGIFAKSSVSSSYHDNAISFFRRGIIDSTAATNNTMYNNNIHDMTYSGTLAVGIQLNFGTWHVWNNTINGVSGTNSGDVQGILLSNSDRNTIHHNTVSNVRGDGIDVANSDLNTIYANTVTRCGYKNSAGDDFLYYGNGGYGVGILVEGSSELNTISRNTVEDNFTGITIGANAGASGNQVLNNISIKSIVNGIGDFGGSTATDRNLFIGNAVIHHPSALNTPAHTGHAYHVQTTGGANNAKVGFYNNLAYNEIASQSSHCMFVSIGTGTVSVYVQNNCWSGVSNAILGFIHGGTPRTLLSDWVADARANTVFGDMAGVQASAESGTIDADPLFINPAGGNYHLQSASPCIGAGVSIPSIHEQAAPAIDLDGNGIYFLPPPIGPYGQGDTKIITSDYSPTGYGIREGATVALGAHGLSVDFTGLTSSENNITVKEAGTYRVYSFTRKAGTTQYVYGLNSGGSGGGIFGSNFC